MKDGAAYFVRSIRDFCDDFIFFVQLGFNLSNGVTDTLESSSVLIYLQTHMGLYSIVSRFPVKQQVRPQTFIVNQ
jgi:hypothetical protein